MIIEIKNAGFENKGAELMLRTIIQVMGKEHTYVMEFNLNSAPYEKRAMLGIFQKSGIVKFGIQFDWFFGLLPKRLLSMLGIIRNKNIDIVLDASGFAYGSPWSDRAIENILIVSKNAKKYNQKLIFLPQAFGEFNKPKSIDKMKKVFENSCLVFARDEVSYANISNLVSKEKLHLSKDFTNLLKVDKDNEVVKDSVVIIPNCRMLDKVDGDKYIILLNKIIDFLLNKGERLIFLNHEGKEDLALCESLSEKWGGIKVLKGGDALEVKRIIGSSKAVVSSRFHGIVSGLSQGVVTIGTSWSHKYEALYKDYDFDEGLITDLDINSKELEKKLSFITNEEQRIIAADKLFKKSNDLKIESIATWKTIKSSIL